MCVRARARARVCMPLEPSNPVLSDTLKRDAYHAESETWADLIVVSLTACVQPLGLGDDPTNNTMTP